MLDIKADKSLWEKVESEDTGTLLMVEESYYDGIIKLVEEMQKEINTYRAYAEENSVENIESKMQPYYEAMEKLYKKEK